MQSLAQQTIQPSGITICVGKSDDRTEEIVLEFQRQSRAPVKVIYDRQGIGTGYAMNKLVETSTGEWLVWVSSDFILPKNWIESIMHILETNNDVDVFDGFQLQVPRDTISAVTAPDVTNSLLLTPLGDFTLSRAPLVSKREALLRVGNFDPYFSRGTDVDMFMRLETAGARLKVCRNLEYLHAGLEGKENLSKGLIRPTFFRFYLYKYGWKAMLRYKHNFLASMMRLSLIPSLLAFVISFSSTWSLVFGAFSLLTIIGLATGLMLTYHRFNLQMFALQMVQCLGEYYQLYKLFAERHKPGFGYGNGSCRDDRKCLKKLYWL